MDVDTPAYRFTSPALHVVTDGPDPSVLYECPTGYVLRETPHLYMAIEAARRDDNLSPADTEKMSHYYHLVTRLYRSEAIRLEELKRTQDKAKRDAEYGARMLGGGR